MRYERKMKNLLSIEETCLCCLKPFTSYYQEGRYNDRDRSCRKCKKHGSRGIPFSEATCGHQTSSRISLTR